MTIDVTSQPSVQLLRGRISNYRKMRRNQDFFFTDADRAKMGATAIAAGLAGLGRFLSRVAGFDLNTVNP
jgi:hypothetical protein